VLPEVRLSLHEARDHGRDVAAPENEISTQQVARDQLRRAEVEVARQGSEARGVNPRYGFG
jgi:hypothetical protein